VTRLCVSELNQLGESSGFSYRLPGLADALARDDTLCVVEGRVQKQLLRQGIMLTLSDVIAHHAYEATSERTPYLSAIVMLEGRAQTRLGSSTAIDLHARSGVITLGDARPMSGFHAPGQRMRSINVVVDDPVCIQDEDLHDALVHLHASIGHPHRPWSPPPHLTTAVDQLLAGIWHGPMHGLLCEGIALQVLAGAMQAVSMPSSTASRTCQRDLQRLERVRDLMQAAPGDDYTLESLARVACMSPSSLRAKFQQTFQCSVFNWLRQRRMEVARERLAQGWTVQQAAHFVGYRHATNFATAFREHYGVPPSQIG